jgi:DNA-binding MarR family transcriptional regulator
MATKRLPHRSESVNGKARAAALSSVLDFVNNARPRSTYVIGRLDRVLNHRITEVVQPHGLNVQQFTALSILGRKRGLSNAQLARRSLITPQAMNQVLIQLTAMGLISRTPNKAHGRKMHTALTAKGQRVLALCEKDMDVLESEMLSDLSKAEQKQFLDSLIACVRALHAGLDKLGE